MVIISKRLFGGFVIVSNYFSPLFKWCGEISLEMYLLQFHVLMCRSVQHIIVVVPSEFYSDLLLE